MTRAVGDKVCNDVVENALRKGMSNSKRLMAGRRLVATAALAATLIATAGCHRAMHDQPRYKPLAASNLWPDGQSARPLVSGTIARGTLHLDDPIYSGLQNGQPIPVMPVAFTEDLLKRGQERYSIYCTPCHGATGEGNGMIVRRGFPAPPSYHIDRLRSAPDGHYFEVITNGFGRMYEYGTRVPVEDRWAIIAYIRALQFSQYAKPEDIPAQELQKLQMETAAR
jgi:mono/diheme cytochrome c family protein